MTLICKIIQINNLIEEADQIFLPEKRLQIRSLMVFRLFLPFLQSDIASPALALAPKRQPRLKNFRRPAVALAVSSLSRFFTSLFYSPSWRSFWQPTFLPFSLRAMKFSSQSFSSLSCSPWRLAAQAWHPISFSWQTSAPLRRS